MLSGLSITLLKLLDTSGISMPLYVTSFHSVINHVFFYRILKGNLAPGGAVAKITGKEGLGFVGKARAFDSEDDFVKAVETGSIKKGEKTVVILRYLGPKGGPGEYQSTFAFSVLSLAATCLPYISTIVARLTTLPFPIVF